MKKELFRKIFFLLFLSFFILTLSSCGESDFGWEDIDKVTYDNILKMTESEYIVVCWKPDCSNCEDLLETVKEYYNYHKKVPTSPALYAINVNLLYNKDMILTDGEYEAMEGTKDYTKIKTKTTPAIFTIQYGTLTHVISDYNTDYPVTKGKSFLNNLMN